MPALPIMKVGVLVVVLLFVCCSSLPLDQRKDQPGKQQPFPGLDKEEFKRYWEDAVKNNPELAKRLGKLRPEDVPDAYPRLADRIAREFPDLRGQFDEARRMNIDELRQFQKVNNWKERPGFQQPERAPQWPEAQRMGGGPERAWPGRHETDDLQNRLREKQRLFEEMDRKRKEEFKLYEMRMEHEQRARLKAAEDEKQKLKLEQELKQHREQLLKHQKLNHPAGRKQLEEVWNEHDGLGQEKFNARTFFFLHDTNGDKYLDPLEMEALFYNEIQKVYGNDAKGMEAHEDMARMREHALTEMDENRDGMVSLEEFMKYTSNKTFDTDEEWKPVRDHPEEVYTEQELEQFEKNFADYESDYDGLMNDGEEEKGGEGKVEHKEVRGEKVEDHKEDKKDAKIEDNKEDKKDAKIEDHKEEKKDEDHKEEKKDVKVENHKEDKKNDNMVVPNEHAQAVGNAA